MEYVGNLKFDPSPYDLASLPDNETAMKDAAAIMPLLRIAAVLVGDSDRGLAKKIRRSDDLETWMGLLEQLVAAREHKKQEYDLLSAGYVRLQVVLERVVGKRQIERTFARPEVRHS
jgi:hypothetical protein